MKCKDKEEIIRLKNQGMLLRKAREKKGLSQSNLAKLIGLSTTSIQNYEAGRNDVVGKNRSKLAAALNLNINDFFVDNKNPINVNQINESVPKYEAYPKPNIKSIINQLNVLSYSKDLNPDEFKILRAIIKEIEN